MIKGFIFDFDGLILDTELPIYATWRQIYQEFNQDLPLDIWVKCVGSSYDAFDPARHLQELVNLDLDCDKLHARAVVMANEIINSTGPLPGVLDFLRTSRDNSIKMAVASSSDEQWVHGHLKRMNMYHFFDGICTLESVQQVKPAPDLFLCALKQLNLAADEAVVFEDSVNGILAARSAGIQVVAIPNDITRHLDFSQAGWIVPSFSGLTPTQVINHFDGNI